MLTILQAKSLRLSFSTKAILLWLIVPLMAHAEPGTDGSEIEDSIRLMKEGHRASAMSQDVVDGLLDKKYALADQVLENSQQAIVTVAYNLQLAKLIQSQEAEVNSLQVQITSIKETEKTLLPLLSEMVSQLSNFVHSDLPFLLNERQSRLEKLASLLDRADLSLAEKYRQILEAYQVEVAYGNTIEAYSGNLISEGTVAQKVNYLRMGRTALYYQSLNGQNGGLWLPDQGIWQSLDDAQNRMVSKAIQMAQQQRVPELLYLPVSTSVSNP